MKKYFLYGLIAVSLASVFLSAPRAHAAITLETSATSSVSFTGSGTTLGTSTFSSTPSKGDLVVVSIGFYGSPPTFSVYDNKGNPAYTEIGTPTELSSAQGWAMFYAQNVSSSANFVVYASSSAQEIYSMGILAYSGIATSSALDKTASSTNDASTTISTGNITTTSTGELYVAVQTHSCDATTAPGAGWGDHKIASEDNDNYVPLSTEDQLGPAAGTYNGNFGITSSCALGGMIASFKPAAGGGGSAPTITSFIASSSTIASGASSTLSWVIATSSNSATSASIDNGIGTVSTSSGTYVVAPTTTTTYTLSANNANGTTTASVTVTVLTVPAAPTIGTATAGNAQATVAFTPGSNGGSAILYYTATANSGGSSATSTVSPITVTGLVNGTSYTFTVTATNAIGTSSSSAASNSVTPTAGGGTTPTYAQSNSAHNFASTSTPVTFSSNVATGSIIAFGITERDTVALNSVTSSCVTGNLTIVDTTANNGTEEFAYQGYGIVSKGGSCTVSANFASASAGAGIMVNEIKGVSTSSPLDVHKMQDQYYPGTGTDAATSGNVTTTASNDYIFGFGSDIAATGVTMATGTNYTLVMAESEWETTEYKILSSVSLVAATFTLDINGEDIIGIMAFKAAAAATTTATYVKIRVGGNFGHLPLVKLRGGGGGKIKLR